MSRNNSGAADASMIECQKIKPQKCGWENHIEILDQLSTLAFTLFAMGKFAWIQAEKRHDLTLVFCRSLCCGCIAKITPKGGKEKNKDTIWMHSLNSRCCIVKSEPGLQEQRRSFGGIKYMDPGLRGPGF